MVNREKLWLEMMKHYGLAEIVGEEDNLTIVGWFKELGFPHIKDDETAWCSLALNIAAKHAGLSFTGRLDARSWLNVGTPTNDPQIGDIVVFWRGDKNSWQGHVGLFAGFPKQEGLVLVLGGNQGNKLEIRAYPINTPNFGLLGYRTI